MATLVTPYDQLSPVGTRVLLEVEVERRLLPFVDPAARGVDVEAWGARGTTGPDGLATLDLGDLHAGRHHIEVHAAGQAVEAVVHVVPKDSPVFVTDIDHTIADVSSAGFIFKPLEYVRAFEGAADALREIATSMSLVYLTARDHVFRRKTKSWLSLFGFPEGPVYPRKGTRFTNTPSKPHKLARLGELTERFPSVLWGVGDLVSDCEAYAERGIRPILIGPRKLEGLPEGTTWVASWADILKTVRT